MLGKPRFKLEDKVKFELNENGTTYVIEGEVYIVDAYGTFFQSDEPSYDIMVEKSHYNGEQCLYKHIPESAVSPL